MQTKIIKSDQIDEAVDLLRNGELVALPTETVYGLAADATNEAALFEIAGCFSVWAWLKLSKSILWLVPEQYRYGLLHIFNFCRIRVRR